MLRIGSITVVCLTALGIAALATGHDAELLNNIVFYIFGVGTGAAVEIMERRAAKV